MAVVSQQVDINAYGSRFAQDFPAGVLKFNADNAVTSSANTAASVVLPAVTGKPVFIGQLHCSWSAAPAAGTKVVILDGVTEVFRAYFGAPGPFEFNFSPPLGGTAGATMTITMDAGGGSTISTIRPNAWVYL